MMIAGERIRKSSFVHDDERNAGCERPRLIGSFSLQADPSIEQVSIRFNDDDIEIGPKIIEQQWNKSSRLRVTKGICDFHDNPLGRNNLRAHRF